MTPATPPTSGSAFRLDINLLRAIAVVGVVLYHFRLGPFPGGFAGVDLFFVVSGYLMTRIIVEGLDRGSFSLGGFYAARARRIVPALAALCVALLALSQLWIDPLTRREITAGIVASMLFVSNFAFWREAGYFDIAAQSKWLLHTWSLSVEWQFYLVLPLVLMALRRLLPGRRFLLAAYWAGAILSFALAASFAETRPAITFYLLPTRAWEMLAGGLVFLHCGGWRPRAALSNLLALAGLALVAIAFVGIDDLVAWPSWATLLPVGGAVLLLVARQETAPGLDSRPVLALGLWSYSIYVWHWPIVVGLAYYGFDGTAAALGGAAATLVIAGLSYRFIETPFRQRPKPGALAHPRWVRFASLAVLAGTMTGALALANATPAPSPLAARTLAAEQAIGDSAYPPECGALSVRDALRPCVIGETAERNLLFIGDSHAEQFFAHLEDGRPGHAFTFLTYGGCAPLPGTDQVMPGSRCGTFIDKAWERAESGDYQDVVLSAYWPVYLRPYQPHANNQQICFDPKNGCRLERDPERYREGMEAAFARLAGKIDELRKKGIAVTLVLPLPDAAIDLPHESVKRAYFGVAPDALAPIDRTETAARASEARTMLTRIAQSTGARLVDPLETMCEAERCAVSRDGVRPDYRDSNHLTRRAILEGRLDFIDAILSPNQDAKRQPDKKTPPSS
ncbi:acyltransferase family protein [Kaistia adipata]|uniref:acyltransferase family protein n=1 Tax=Kaistia adipata TaxID=166954 RepID=UPI0003F9D8D2|nr:acyltransferase family protein [Kaistia adipata]